MGKEAIDGRGDGDRLRLELWIMADQSSGVLGTLASMLCLLAYITYGQGTTLLLKIR